MGARASVYCFTDKGSRELKREAKREKRLEKRAEKATERQSRHGTAEIYPRPTKSL